MMMYRLRPLSLVALLVLVLASVPDAFAQGRLSWDQAAPHRSDALVGYLYEASYGGGPFQQILNIECEGVSSPFACSGSATSDLRPVRVRAVDIIDTVRYESSATSSEDGQAPAPTPPVTAVTVTVYRQGQTSPAVAPQSIPLSAFTCDLQTMPPPVAINPGGIAFEDPARPGRFCAWTSPANGVFSLLAYDVSQLYELDAAFVNAAATGAATRSASFSKPGLPPVAPAQLRLTAGQ